MVVGLVSLEQLVKDLPGYKIIISVSVGIFVLISPAYTSAPIVVQFSSGIFALCPMEPRTSCESLVAGSKLLFGQPQPATPDRKHGASCL